MFFEFEREREVNGGMAKVGIILAFAISALLISSWVQVSNCLKKPAGVARREDIPYIKCQVCEKVAAQLYRQVQKKQSQISPKKVYFYVIRVRSYSTSKFSRLDLISMLLVFGGRSGVGVPNY